MAAATSDTITLLDKSTVLEQKHFNPSTNRCEYLQGIGRRLLATCDTSEMAVLHFAKQIERGLDAIRKFCDTYNLLSTKMEKAWSKFHSFRCNKLIILWNDFLMNICVTGRVPS